MHIMEDTTNKEEQDKLIYLKGYKNGMYAGLTIAWALAEELKIDIHDKEILQKINNFINALKN